MSQGRKRNDRGSKRLIESRVTGVVKRYIDTGGYGFITEDDTNRDIFFHISAVSKNNRRLGDPIRVGDEVIYDLYLAPKGYRAESVQILNQDLEGSDSDDDDNLYRKKKSGSGLGNGGGGGAGNRRVRGRGLRYNWNRRGGSVGRGHERRDDDDYESDNGGRGAPSGDRMPRSNIRSNGSTWGTRSPSRGRREGCQGGQPGIKETKSDSGLFCRYCQCFHNSCKKCTYAYQNGNRSDNGKGNVKENTESTNGSFPTFEAGRPASKTRLPGAEPINPRSTFSFQGTQRVNPDTKPNPQSTSTAGNAYSFFDHLKTPNDTGKGADIKKNTFGNRDSFPRTGASSQGSRTGTQYTTYTKKSDTERKSPDTNPKPQPSPHYYSFSNLYGAKASNFNDAKDDISRNPSRPGSSYRTGVSPEGNNKGTQNTTDTKPNMDKSDREPNPQPWRKSTVYSYSYANGSNRFSVPLKNANNRKDSSSSGTGKQMPTNNSRSVPGDESAKPAGDSKDPTKVRGVKDDVESKKKPTTHELPNQQGKGTGGTTSPKDKSTTGSGNMPKMNPKASTSTSLSSISRETGNMFFRSARDQKGDIMKFFKLKSALACYTKAYNWSKTDEDLVSAAKNAGTTYWRLASLKMASGGASDEKVIHEYFKDGLQYFSKAYSKRNCRGQAWAKHLEKSIQDCLDDIRTWIAPKDEDDRIVALKEYLGYLPACGAKVNGYLHIANIYFKSGKEALCFDEYENCEGYLKDCRVPLGEAEKMCANMDQSIQLNVTALKKKVEYHEGLVKKSIARAKDVQARQERERAEEREKKIATEQLKADMKALDILTKLSIEDFVQQVYRLWPPKGSKGPNPPGSSSSSSSSSSTASKKKLLIRTISQYHPDKVDKNVHGIKWHLLSCEITKCLSMRLAKIK